MKMLKIFVVDITRHDDKIDSIKHGSLIYYCIYQLVYGVFLLIYGIIFPYYFKILLSSFLFTFPLNILTIYLSKKNYHLVGRVYLVVSFVLASAYLFTYKYSEPTNNISTIQFLIIAILALIVDGYSLGIFLFFMGLVSLVVDNLLYHFGDIGLPLTLYNSFDSLVLNGISITCMFGFIIYFINSFNNYYKKYSDELKKTISLNEELVFTNKNLSQLNCELEENIATIEEANNRFEKFAWLNSHDLRGPVARILGLIYVSKLESSDIKTDFYHDKIYEETQNLDKIIKEMNGLLSEITRIRKDEL